MIFPIVFLFVMSVMGKVSEVLGLLVVVVGIGGVGGGKVFFPSFDLHDFLYAIILHIYFYQNDENENKH